MKYKSLILTAIACLAATAPAALAGGWHGGRGNWGGSGNWRGHGGFRGHGWREMVTALAVPFGTSVLGSVFRLTVASTRGTSAGIIPTLDTIHMALTRMADIYMVDITGATTSTADTRMEAIPAMFIGAGPGATAILLWSREFNND